MSRTLSSLLGVDENSFSALIKRLDAVTLHDGVDVRFTAEMITKSRDAVRGLGLDPTDSTYEEVYWALRAKSVQGDDCLRRKLKIPQSNNEVFFSIQETAKASQNIAKALHPLVIQESVMCVQASALKRILRAVPPKKILKILHFRSITSVLRREDPRLLYALALHVESDTWRNQVLAQLKRLKAKDVVEQAPEILSLPSEWVEKIGDIDFGKVCISNAEIGVVVLLPTIPLSTPGAILLTSAIALQAVETMVVESLPYRTQALTAGIETLIHEIAAGNVSLLDSIHGMQPSWHAVYRLLTMKDKQLPEFEFVLQDLSWEATETKLASLCPELDYWVDKHFLGYAAPGLPLSFHIIDVAVSEVLQKKWGDQIVSHLRASLWNELQLQYLKHDNFEKAVIQQLTYAQDIVLE